MEYLDIFDENNKPLGIIKEKSKVHEDVDYHRTAHVWIINNKKELLIQKRSKDKKNNPNCWDISGAGHIKAGEDVINGAIRELKEELGVYAKEEDLKLISIIKSEDEPNNCEFAYVYLLESDNKVEDYVFEDKEVSEVKYVYYEDLERMVKEKEKDLLMHEEEFRDLFDYIRKNYILLT